MANKISKIGIIQTAPLAGDFSNNLRHIVQGYRECLDHGAELVIAPAAALCGLEPGNLVNRPSFLQQTKAALDTLSRELGDAPLILGAYTRTVSDDEYYVGMLGEGDDDDWWLNDDHSVFLTPYLLEKDSVTELENATTVNIRGTEIFTDTGDEELLPDEPHDIMVRIPCTPWYAGAAKDDEETRNWEAEMSNSVVICCRPTGTGSINVYGGGSAVYTPEHKTILRLPFFENAARVVNLQRPLQAPALPDAVELLSSALERGIRDNVRNNGFTGVCLPLDYTSSALLATLCIEALGAENVCGISFDKENKLAEKLGIANYTPAFDALAAAGNETLGGNENTQLQERLRTAVAMTHAESRGLMLCSPLSRRELMLGEFCMYGRSGGHLAPLGNLYDVDLFMLSERMQEKYDGIFGSLTAPENGIVNRIIHELADRNTPPSTLLSEENNYMFKENDVRLIQRKLLASALKRTQLPIIIHVDPPNERLFFPVTHRLND